MPLCSEQKFEITDKVNSLLLCNSQMYVQIGQVGLKLDRYDKNNLQIY